ncbi:hypothetical protein [Microvirga thermotolerans]|uniref:Uncharacterized protein n=1 Tax=Microvirga thermotolerans TaxID=2651334 RepID=A0A5P9JUK3_9HYPH|nr:hypothetical protein [Microvirga thermotolerans]QFU15859.1 hypothetical protein GDR74_06275 [Microvirga thermotolerans]
MADLDVREPPAGPRTIPSRPPSPDLESLYQSLLTTLADIDFDYQCERDRLDRAMTDPARRKQARNRLEARHRERRMPYLHQLILLQDRLQRQ